MADRGLQSSKIARVGPAAWLGWTGLVGYLGWNLFWISRCQVPPSLWKYLTGWPAPSTGMTRSWLALFEGRWIDSLLWNPFTIPLTLAWIGTLGWAALCLLRRQSLHAPRWFLPGWLALLTFAWTAKFVLGPAWW